MKATTVAMMFLKIMTIPMIIFRDIIMRKMAVDFVENPKTKLLERKKLEQLSSVPAVIVQEKTNSN